ncbi:MAG: hypothetical protein DDT24_00445 [Chloroflexi bacterium]|nr:hypothetical protein [Chloroflexota bacterium]
MNWGHIQGGRQIIHNGVENWLNADVPQRTAAQNRNNPGRDGSPAQTRFDSRNVDLLIGDIGKHDLIIRLSQILDQCPPIPGYHIPVFIGNGDLPWLRIQFP